MNCITDTCGDSCGCKDIVKGKCVFYNGSNLDCIGVTKGDDYDSILAVLDTKICELEPPSAVTTIVQGCSNITVTSNSTGNVTTYTVCLDSDVSAQIDNNTTNISTISTCLSNTVADIVSNTAIITEESSDDCGRTIRIELPTPSGTPTYNGIVYNNTTKSTYTNTAGTKILKSYTGSYITNNLLSDEEEIRFRATGQIQGDGTDVDDVIIQLYDSTGAVVLNTQTFRGWALAEKQSWLVEGVITATDVASGDGLYQIQLFANSVENGISSNINSGSKMVVNADLSGVDFDNLTIRIIYTHNSTTADTTNFARQLKVEVVKLV